MDIETKTVDTAKLAAGLWLLRRILWIFPVTGLQQGWAWNILFAFEGFWRHLPWFECFVPLGEISGCTWYCPVCLPASTMSTDSSVHDPYPTGVMDSERLRYSNTVHWYIMMYNDVHLVDRVHLTMASLLLWSDKVPNIADGHGLSTAYLTQFNWSSIKTLKALWSLDMQQSWTESTTASPASTAGLGPGESLHDIRSCWRLDAGHFPVPGFARYERSHELSDCTFWISFVETIRERDLKPELNASIHFWPIIKSKSVEGLQECSETSQVVWYGFLRSPVSRKSAHWLIAAASLAKQPMRPPSKAATWSFGFVTGTPLVPSLLLNTFSRARTENGTTSQSHFDALWNFRCPGRNSCGPTS